jgi:secreted trypsin-like serine protease
LNSTSNKQPSQKAGEQSSLEETGSSREFVTEKRTVESKDTAALEQANCEVFKSRSLFDTPHTAKGESGEVARDKSATMGTEVPVAAQDNKRQERKVEEDAADLEAKS